MHEATLLILGDGGVFSCSGEHGEMAYFLMGSGVCFVNALCDVLPVLFLHHLLQFRGLVTQRASAPAHSAEPEHPATSGCLPTSYIILFCSSFLFPIFFFFSLAFCTLYSLLMLLRHRLPGGFSFCSPAASLILQSGLRLRSGEGGRGTKPCCFG